MHPTLTERHQVCAEQILALEECHKHFLKTYTGGCNDLKTELNLCLRRLRLERTQENLKKAREKRARLEATWRQNELETQP